MRRGRGEGPRQCCPKRDTFEHCSSVYSKGQVAPSGSKGSGVEFWPRGYEPQGVLCPVRGLAHQPRRVGPDQVEKEGRGGRGGVPVGSQRVPAIASEVGPGDGDLGTSKEGSDLQRMGRISASHGTTRRRDGGLACNCHPVREKKTRAYKGDGGGKRTRRDAGAHGGYGGSW